MLNQNYTEKLDTMLLLDYVIRQSVPSREAPLTSKNEFLLQELKQQLGHRFDD